MNIVICGDTESINLNTVRRLTQDIDRNCRLIINGSGSGINTIADIVSTQYRIPMIEFPIPISGFTSDTDCIIAENIFSQYKPDSVLIFHNKLFSSKRSRIITEYALRTKIAVMHYTDTEFYCYPDLSSFLSNFN